MPDADEIRPDPALAEPLPHSPLPALVRWLDEARACETIRNPDALALATVDSDGRPEVRMVLCRGVHADRAEFSFYTNRESPKAVAIERSGTASGVFYWDPLDRQVRISGRVERAPDEQSDAYFASRHPQSQIAARASRQSHPLASRAELLAAFEAEAEALGWPDSGRPIPRPAGWGGYVLRADRIELWAGRAGRLHDRAVWVREPTRGSAPSGALGWQAQRLQP